MSNLKNYINESSNRSKNNSKEHFLYKTIPVYIDPDLFFLDGKSNIRQVLDMVESSVPVDLASGIDVIYVGDFEEFQEKRFNNSTGKDKSDEW